MSTINFTNEVEKRREEIILSTQAFLQINSVLDEETATNGQPFGKGIMKALNYLLMKGKEDQFTIKNLDGYAGTIEFGQGEDLVGVLCHIDVVPPGDGWTSPPFAADIRNGNVYARGAIDDKGPTMAAYFAMKIVKDLELPLSKRVRMIIGTDEESEWRCVEHYFAHDEMPTTGFAPDADFPIIHAEKGIADIEFSFPTSEKIEEQLTLLTFRAGQRVNMVPDLCEATVSCKSQELQVSIEEQFQRYLEKRDLKGYMEKDGELIHIRVHGVSAHGMEPKNGINAGVYVGEFLHSLFSQPHPFLQFITSYLVDESRGQALGIAWSDKVSGDLTINPGVFSFSSGEGGKISCTIRYPVTHTFELLEEQLQQKMNEYNMRFTILSHSTPHYVKEDSPLIQTLQRVYEKQMGEKATLVSIGGGTYARSLKEGVAFGPLFPGRPDVAHQKDEYISIDDLLQATALYAEAIYELAKK